MGRQKKARKTVTVRRRGRRKRGKRRAGKDTCLIREQSERMRSQRTGK